MSTTDSGTCRWEAAVGAEEEDSEGVRQTTLFHISEIHLDLKTKKSKRRPILSNSEQVNLEAEMVNRNMLERKIQFTYLALTEPWPKVSGFAKVYLFTGELKKYMYGDKKFRGEPLFLSRSPDSKKEDDGYILAFVHIEKEWKSMFCTANIEVDEI